MWELPGAVSLRSFALAWPRVAGGLGNSVVLAVPASLISSLLGCANGFVLAKWRFRGAGLGFPLILFGVFLPYQAILLPLVPTKGGAGPRGRRGPARRGRGVVLRRHLLRPPDHALVL